MVSTRLASELRKAWVPVYVWTVNDGLSMRKHLGWGVLGIVTGYPNVARKVVSRFEEESNGYYMYNEIRHGDQLGNGI